MEDYAFTAMPVPGDHDMQCSTMFPVSGHGVCCQWMYTTSPTGGNVTQSLLMAGHHEEQLGIRWEDGELVIDVPDVPGDSGLDHALKKDGVLWCALRRELQYHYEDLLECMKCKDSEGVVRIVERWFYVCEEYNKSPAHREDMEKASRNFPEKAGAFTAAVKQREKKVSALHAVLSWAGLVTDHTATEAPPESE